MNHSMNIFYLFLYQFKYSLIKKYKYLYNLSHSSQIHLHTISIRRHPRTTAAPAHVNVGAQIHPIPAIPRYPQSSIYLGKSPKTPQKGPNKGRSLRRTGTTGWLALRCFSWTNGERGCFPRIVASCDLGRRRAGEGRKRGKLRGWGDWGLRRCAEWTGRAGR